jgi:zinc/manganese transport system substrate-binding protein
LEPKFRALSWDHHAPRLSALVSVAWACLSLLAAETTIADQSVVKPGIVHATPFRIVATTTDLAALSHELAPDATVVSLAQGAEDPHDIEAKPSFIGTIKSADVLIENGAGLESSWLPGVLAAARRESPKLTVLNVSEGLPLLKSEAGGEHGLGNPHFMLDPDMVVRVGAAIAKTISDLKPSDRVEINQRLKTWTSALLSEEAKWKKLMVESPFHSVVTYHAGLDYFLKRFNVQCAGTLEPAPGIQPTASHILAIEKLMRANKTKLILIESYEDETQGARLREDIEGSVVRRAYVAVGAKSGLNRSETVIDGLVRLFATTP